MNREKSKKKLALQLAFLIFLIIGTIIIVRQQRTMPYQHNTGFIFGTVYNITYQSDKNLQKEIEAELQKVDASLSPFNKSSIISKVNRNEKVEVNSMFTDVFNLAQKISEETGGAFDITVAPLVNAWGFGFKNDTKPTPAAIDSLKQIIGYKKVRLDGKQIVKNDKRIMLDCSAIAKGYGSDAVARLLRSKGIENFMVEIGGEIVTRGINEKRLPWKIGVTKPVDDSLNTNHTERNQQSNGYKRKLPQLLLQRRQEICPHHRPHNRLSCTAQHIVGNCFGRQLRHGRRLCHSLHGDGT